MNNELSNEIHVTPDNIQEVLGMKRPFQEKKERISKGKKKVCLFFRVGEYCLVSILVCITMGICISMLKASTDLSSGSASLLTAGIIAAAIYATSHRNK